MQALGQPGGDGPDIAQALGAAPLILRLRPDNLSSNYQRSILQAKGILSRRPRRIGLAGRRGLGTLLRMLTRVPVATDGTRRYGGGPEVYSRAEYREKRR